jgi:hypothetical protein
MDNDSYSRLCERSTHVTPETKPSLHTDERHPRVGPHQQERGAKEALSELTYMLVCTSLAFAKFTFNDALFEELQARLNLEAGAAQ